MISRRLDLKTGADDRRLLAFFAYHGRSFNEPTQAIWLEGGGDILGGWVFTGFNGATIQVHIAGWAALNHAVLHAVFAYSFDQLAVKVIIAAVPGSNTRALKIGRKLGFQELATIEEVDLHLLTMNRAQCRWLGVSRG